MKNENINIRFADVNNDKDRNGVICLWQRVFGDDKEYIEYFLDNCHNKKCLAVFDDNNTILSMLFLIDCTLDSKKGAYVYAVSTDENYRKRGFMALLLEKSSKMLYDFLCLIPAEDYLFEIYARFGYERCVYRLNNDLCKSLSCCQSADYQSYFEGRKKHLPDNYIEICDSKYVYNENILAEGSFLVDNDFFIATRYSKIIECLPKNSSNEPFGMIRFKNKKEMKKCYISFVLD